MKAVNNSRPGGVWNTVSSALLVHRDLTWELTKRDVESRYRGANFGVLWSVLTPVLMLLVYIMAFGSIMKSKWPGTDDSIATFSLIIFAGLIIHGFFAECLSKASTIITANTSYVKKVMFPLEILPWQLVLGAFFHLAINLIVLIGAILIVNHRIPPTLIYLPVVLVPFVLMMLGISYFVAAISVYFRDTNQIISPLVTAALFLSSAVVPINSIPRALLPVFNANPITLIVNQLRNIALWDKSPDWASLGIYTCIAIALTVAGAWTFDKLRGGFADVL